MPLWTPHPTTPLIALSSDFIRAKEYFEAIVASCGDLICTTDIRGRIIYFSPGAEAMLGLPAAQAMGLPAHDLYEGGRKAAQDVMSLLRDSPEGLVRNHQTRVRASEGRILTVSLSASFLKDGRKRVIGTLGIAKDISDRVLLEERLRKMARTDDLTGLYNQRHFHDRLKEEATRAQRQRRKLSIIIFDLDGFKQVNDRLGHLEGDRILKTFAQTLTDSVRREVDSVFRYGGDEFIVLLPETSAARAARVARRAGCAVKASLGREGVSTSWGVSEISRDGDMAALVREADAAMYEMKSGRQGVRLRGTAIARAFR